MAAKRLLGSLKPEYLYFLLVFLFSWFLMWQTFRVNSEGNLEIATKVWSDFSATIPLIRSFSFGANLPPEYPLFAGPGIRYHFLFFAFVGFLESLGIPLDWALNTISAMGFFLLLIAIYLLSKALFKSRAVGALSMILFTFNGSLGFLEFFKKNLLSIDVPGLIIRNTEFSSFGPYDGKVVSAFWSLNIFTNQRHLAFSYAAYLFLVLSIYKFSKKLKKFTWTMTLLLGVVIGLFPFFHLAVFGMMGITLIIFFLIYKKLRLKIFAAGSLALILALPQFLYMGTSQIETNLFHVGYLVDNLTLFSITKYWFLNLGLTVFLLPIGLYMSKRSQRKIFIPFLALFAVGNLFQFSPEAAANHKFFNLFLIGANIFVAYFLIKLWSRKKIGKTLVVLIFPFLILTGVIDFFPIVNDRFVTVEDIPNNKTANFIYQNTPKGSAFLNAKFLYDPASLAGRKIFLGWPYFAWSAGYNSTQRHSEMQKLLNTPDKLATCTILKAKNIDYVEIQNPTYLESVEINYSFFEDNFVRIFLDEEQNISLYSVEKSC